MTELFSKGAVELATMIAAGDVSSTEVVEAHLARIAEVNPVVNAVTVTLADEARAAAAAVDRDIAAGRPVGPLAGVPFSVKENIDVAGSATTWGAAALAGQIASTDAPAVARLREAGAIPLARTNLPDFAFRWDTLSSRSGRTANPWDLTRTPGGSSGGEAAASATGMTPFGLGNDLGGSLRVPAQMCGVSSLRPSRGRVADASVTQPGASTPMAFQVTNTQGPVARKVADLRAALGIISAPDPDGRDPQWVPAPLDFGRSGQPVRVAVVRDPLGEGIDPHVRAGVDRAADVLADAGYDVVDAEPPMIAEATAAWVAAVWADLGLLLPGMAPITGEDQARFVGACLENGVFVPVDQETQLHTWMAVRRIGSEWARFLADFPIILSPASCERPWRSGDDITRVKEVVHAARMLWPVNILGLPACTVPVGADDGLPQGVQLIGARFTEHRLLDAGQAIEDRVPALTPIMPRVATMA